MVKKHYILVLQMIFFESGNMGTEEMSIKLMLDAESNRLIFAEASKDFVDFLIFILTVPIGTVTRLLTSESMAGSIGNIYKSVENLDETYIRRNVDKDDILYPTSFSSPTNIPLSGLSITILPELYTCSDPDCNSGYRNVNHGVECPGCGGTMDESIEVISRDSKGYVKSAATYMIYDDLSITSLSSSSILSMMNKFNVTKLEERKVKIGNEEALELLKASLQSTTVLSDVFLKTKKRKRPGNEQREMKILIETPRGKFITLEVDPCDTINSVKTKLEEMEGIHPKQIRLSFAGRQLEDDQTVADCNIVNKSLLRIILLCGR